MQMLLNAEIASMRENILLSFMLICRGGEGGEKGGRHYHLSNFLESLHKDSHIQEMCHWYFRETLKAF